MLLIVVLTFAGAPRNMVTRFSAATSMEPEDPELAQYTAFNFWRAPLPTLADEPDDAGAPAGPRTLIPSPASPGVPARQPADEGTHTAAPAAEELHQR